MKTTSSGDGLPAASVRVATTLLLLSLLLLAAGCARPRNDAGVTSGSRPVIQNKGSDTLVNVAQTWAERYRDVEDDVAVAVSGGGSGTGIAALINGTVDLANASRQIDPEELELAREHGQDPIEFVVGYDALAVYVHRDNPLDRISIAQLAEIYGEGATIERWSQLGVEVPGCRSDEIIVVSRQNNSGTYEYFREAVLGDRRDYRLGTHDLHGSKDVVDLVQHTPCAIGYSGLAYATPQVKDVCVVPRDGAPCVRPTVESAVDRSYPISRPLFMYTAQEPAGAVDAYLDWILSDAGQCILSDAGYAPVRVADCTRVLTETAAVEGSARESASPSG